MLKFNVTSFKAFAADLSLANMCFLSVWIYLFYNNNDGYNFFLSGSPVKIYIAAFLNTFILTLVLYLLRVVEERRTNKIVSFIRCCFLLSAIFIIMIAVRRFYMSGFTQQTNTILNVVILLSIAVIARACIGNYAFIFRSIHFTSIILFPFVLVNMSNAAIRAARWETPSKNSMQPSLQSRPLASLNTPHIIWVIFDEMDQRISFRMRPDSIKLPEFDKFRAGAFFANNALPPSNATRLSMPVLISGQSAIKTIPISSNDLNFTLANGRVVRWSALPSIFSSFKKHGWNSQILGWYLPYSRIFGEDAVSDVYIPGHMAIENENFYNIMLFLATYPLPYKAIGFIQGRMQAKHHILIYKNIHHRALDAITAPYSLTLLHYPIPHFPNIYDHTTSEFTANLDPSLETPRDYLGNLVLADRTFGELRNKLEKTGMWEMSTIIVSADHWWRFSKNYYGKTDFKVPFMVKLAGQNASSAYSKPFSTVITANMIMNIGCGNIRTNAELASWLDENGKNIQPVLLKEIVDIE